MNRDLEPGTPLTKEQFRERMTARLEAAKKAKQAAQQPPKKRHPWKGPVDNPPKKRTTSRMGRPGITVVRSDGAVFHSRMEAAQAGGYNDPNSIKFLIQNGRRDKHGFTYTEVK